MQLGSSIRRRRKGERRSPSGARGATGATGSRGRAWASALRGRARWLLVAAAVGGVGFGGGWLVATRVLFPPPPPPGDLYDVPDLYAVDVDEATRRLARAGLTLGMVDPFRHPTLDSGAVVGQHPLPGQLARPGQAVRLSVSLGVERRPVPEVRQLRGDRARVVLEATGFVVRLDSIQSNEPLGRVVSVEPAPGTLLPMPGEVHLEVSLGPPQVVMPLLVGMDEAEAREAVESLGLLLRIERVLRPDAEAGHVVEQDPPPDRVMERGSVVRIQVAGAGLPADTLRGG